MYGLIFSVVLLAFSLGNSESHASEIDLRIEGGEFHPINERYLFTVGGPAGLCNCAVLSEKWLLGTSYCFVVNRYQNGSAVELDGIFFIIRFYEDLAFLQLADPLPGLQLGLVKAIALPDLDEHLNLTDTNVTIYGPFDTVLRNMTLEIGDACKKFYESPRAMDNYVCMEITEERTTCMYDDGALMVVDGKLAGIATVTKVYTTCPTAATYQQFIKISAFRRLIHSVTGL